jgi:CRISPR-associated protein Cmr1
VKIIRATYEIATPMFVSGADQTKAELRIPSIRGALRFWWRALAYAPARGDLDEIRRREANLFGDTKRQSGVILSFDADEEPASERMESLTASDDKGYIGYGLLANNGKSPRSYFPSGTHFVLRIILDPRLSDVETTSFLDACVALGLLGGVGGRSRRGWGSLTLQTITVDRGAVWSMPRSESALRDEIDRLLSPSRSCNVPPAYSAFWRKAEVVIARRSPKAKDAHDAIGNDYRDFLLDPKPHGGTTLSANERVAFGLPRRGKANRDQRRASAVWLHVHRFSESLETPVVTFFPTDAQAGTATQPGAGWGPAERFLRFVDVRP